MDYSRRFLAAPAPAHNPAHWAVGELAPGDAILSATRAFKLIFQTDGNLVLYGIDDVAMSYQLHVSQASYPTALWASGTQGSGAVRCTMQEDGNLVLYNAAGSPVWATGTNGNPGAFLSCQDDGNQVIYGGDYSGAPVLWSSGTYPQSHADSMGSTKSPSPFVGTGFGFQLNAWSPRTPPGKGSPWNDAWQQFVIAVLGDQITATINDWQSPAKYLVFDTFDLLSLSGPGRLPKGMGLKIDLAMENGVVSAATFTVYEQHSSDPPYASKTVELSSIGGFAQSDFAPIIGFQVVLVGPDNSACAFLSSGSGKIIYQADQPLTPQAGDPRDAAQGGGTAETANTSYGTLSSTASTRTVQTFSRSNEQQG